MREPGLQYSILRPTVIFGPDPILANNIAYLLRTCPVFTIPGDGKYRIQPVYVEDLAELMVAEGASRDSRILDAVGPETFAYDEFVRLIARAVPTVSGGDICPRSPSILIRRARVDKELSDARERFVESWGSTDELMERLQISRGNANMNLRARSTSRSVRWRSRRRAPCSRGCSSCWLEDVC